MADMDRVEGSKKKTYLLAFNHEGILDFGLGIRDFLIGD
jgi:hypothetical protein